MAVFTLQGSVRDTTGNVTTASVNLTVASGSLALTLTPTALAFGNLAVGTTSPILSAVLTNVSAARVLFTGGSSMSGSADFHYIVDNCTGGGLNAGASCTLQYTFVPTTAGAKTGANLIQYNDGSVKTISLPFTGTGTTTVPPPPTGAIVDPTLLPVANKQAPSETVYNALNIPSQPVGFSYNDPVTGVKIWKVTSSTVPNSNIGMGHDYGEGPNEVSRGWGPNNNTHTILLRRDVGSDHFLVDFTRGVGFTNYRALPSAMTPRSELSFSFSALAGQERIAYSLTFANQLVRVNTATMAVENTGNFPANIGGSGPPWLQQDYQDVWFVGLQTATTAFAWNSVTGQLLTDTESWLNEPRLERNGRYVVLTTTVSNSTARYWDLSNNSLGSIQTLVDFAHCASLRGRWVAVNTQPAAPPPLDRYQVAGGTITRTASITSNSGGYGTNNSGNWIQDDVATQWAYISGTDTAEPWQNLLLVNRGIGVVRADGSDFRLLCHHYANNPTSNYYDLVWGKPSPDGKVLIFNSNMNINGGRHDLFVVEVPLR